MSFISSVTKTNKEKIIQRFLELFDTSDELKNLFISLLPNNSLLKKLMDIESLTDKNEICEILVEFLGENFLHTVGKIPSQDEYGESNDADGKFIIRQKLLEQICKKHHDPEIMKETILNEFNSTRKNKVNYDNFSDMG